MIIPHDAHYLCPIRSVRLAEISQVQYEINDAADEAPVFIEFWVLFPIFLDPVST